MFVLSRPSRDSHGSSMVKLCESYTGAHAPCKHHGRPMKIPWTHDGSPMEFHGKLHGSKTDDHGTPVEVPINGECPMELPHNSDVSTMEESWRLIP